MEKPIIISLECTTEICSVCLSEGEELLSIVESERTFSHIETITTSIDTCLSNASISIKEVNAVAIAAGPGSYTGLRVAASTAKGVCLALDVPLIAIDSLLVLAESANGLLKEGDYVIPMIDARRMEVYTAILDHNLKLVRNSHSLILDHTSFKEFKSNRLLLCGNGAGKFVEAYPDERFKVITDVTSSKYMVNIAFRHFSEESFVNYQNFSPNYLKSPKITASKKKWF